MVFASHIVRELAICTALSIQEYRVPMGPSVTFSGHHATAYIMIHRHDLLPATTTAEQLPAGLGRDLMMLMHLQDLLQPVLPLARDLILVSLSKDQQRLMP